MNLAVLKILDGYGLEIDLLSRRRGYHLNDWRPARPEMVFGLTNNYYTGAEIPFSMTRKPAIEVFNFKANGHTVDALIELEQDLNRYLGMAVGFWSGNKAVLHPFYIEAKAARETNTRYALIYTAQFHDSSNPYGQPFNNPNIPLSDELSVTITHGPWTELRPGFAYYVNERAYSQYTALYDGRTYGVPSPNEGYSEQLYITNYMFNAGLTHVFHGPAGDNQQDATLVSPYGFPIFDGVAFYTYVGREWNGTNNDPFSNVVMFVYSGATSRWIDFEYYNGSWVTLPAWSDRGLSSTNAGGLSVGPRAYFWNVPDDWVETTINGVLALWIRMDIGGETPAILPYQKDYPLYTTSWPWFDYDNSSDVGDDGVMLDISLSIPLADLDDDVSEWEQNNQWLLGARSHNRDVTTFLPIINSLTVNIEGSGITMSMPGGNIGVNYQKSYCDVIRYIDIDYGLDGLGQDFLKIIFDPSVHDAYHGRFRMFARVSIPVADDPVESGLIYWYAEIYNFDDPVRSPGDVLFRTKKVTDTLNGSTITSLDFGSVYLGNKQAIEQTIALKVDIDSTVDGQTLQFIDLVLVPDDDWTCQINLGQYKMTSQDIVNIRTATTFGELEVSVTDRVTGAITKVPVVHPGRPLVFNHQHDIRFYLYSWCDRYGNLSWNGATDPRHWSNFYTHLSLYTIQKVNLYKSSRGSK